MKQKNLFQLWLLITLCLVSCSTKLTAERSKAKASRRVKYQHSSSKRSRRAQSRRDKAASTAAKEPVHEEESSSNGAKKLGKRIYDMLYDKACDIVLNELAVLKIERSLFESCIVRCAVGFALTVALTVPADLTKLFYKSVQSTTTGFLSNIVTKSVRDALRTLVITPVSSCFSYYQVFA